MRGKSLILASSAAAAIALSAGAASAEPNGWYGAIDAGWHRVGQAEIYPRTGVGYELETEAGWAAFARLGYRFNDNWRLELESGYRQNELEAANRITPGSPNAICAPATTGPCGSPTGDLKAFSLLANVLFDFGSAESQLRPFIGAGAGLARTKADFTGTNSANRAILYDSESSETSLAAQLLAGVAWEISDRALLDLTYRYFKTDLDGRINSPLPANTPGDFEGTYEDSHAVTLGLRVAFGADAPPPPPPPPYVPPPVVAPPPPPPPPPAPRPAPPPIARQFVVYFDWDRSDLTAEAQSVVSQAAAYARSGRPTRVLVVGHADTSGSAQYNIGLSNRRARTVADALVAQGVNGGVVSLDAKGETQLARATPDGVREPLNRRATIDINF